MFDFASASRNEGDTRGTNDKGLVTYDRKIPKDAFYFYKAQWNKEPMAYITSRRHVIREHADTKIKVYSNCDKVLLLVNGTTISTVTPASGIATWDKVTLHPGKNEITVIGTRDGKTVTDSCEWILK